MQIVLIKIGVIVVQKCGYVGEMTHIYIIFTFPSYCRWMCTVL